MKKLIISILIFLSIKSYSQDLSGINVNLTLRAGDWCFVIGASYQSDSVGISITKRLRDTILLANPANFNTNVRFNNMPAIMVFNIYTLVKNLPTTLYEQVGTNIDTQIKGISNSTLQAAITSFDSQAQQLYLQNRRRGKNILQDN